MSKYEKSAVFDFILVIVLFIFMGVVVFMKVDNSIYKTRDERSLEDFSTSWHTDKGKEVSLEDVGEKAERNTLGELEINLYHTFPAYLVSDTILNFRTKNIKFQVSIGDKIIYNFMPDDQQVLSRGNGSTFHRIDIKTDDAGKEIGLKIFPIYKDRSSRITSMYLGRTWDYFGKVLDENFWSFQFSIITILIGVILVTISFLSKLDSGHNERNRMLGVFTVCMGLWVMCETLMPQFMFGHSSQFNEINHLLLIFMPYFFISYVYQDLEYSRDYILKISFVLTVIELILISGLSIMGVMDSHESLFIVHIGIAITILLILLAIYDNITYCKKNKIKGHTVTLVVTLGVFLISIIWDMISYYKSYSIRDGGSLMRTAILIGVVILAVDSLCKLFEGIKETELSNKVFEIKYKDSLTGLANRNAYELKEKEIQKKLDKGEIDELLICKFDMNDLRKINDNYGHSYGDRHIIKCAEIINQSFGKSGYTFRVDCDEFAVFVIGDGVEYIYERGILRLKELEREFNRTPDLLAPLRIGYGHVIFNSDTFGTVEKAVSGADKKMYECKDMIKKGAIV